MTPTSGDLQPVQASGAERPMVDRIPPLTQDAGVPWAGVALLVALLLVAAAARWWGRRAKPGRDVVTGWRLARAAATGGPEMPRTYAAGALDPRTRLVVVEWQGERLLVACSAGLAPVVLTRESIAAAARPGSGGTAA